MELSFERTEGAGLYRSGCCHSLVEMARGKVLPLCPVCHEVTGWELLPARGSVSALRDRKESARAGSEMTEEAR